MKEKRKRRKKTKEKRKKRYIFMERQWFTQINKT